MVGAADVADLAGGDKVFVGAQRLVHRHEHVGLVAEIEIEVVGLQPAQARLARRDQILARQAGADAAPGNIRW